MLLQFNVSNFMSIKDEVCFSAFANAGTDHSDRLINVKGKRILPSLAFYGANAAGKSNLFKALSAAIVLVRNSGDLQVNSATGIVPFLMDKDSRNKPTSMDFIFIHNGIEYEYGFKADSRTVYEEYLYKYTSAKPSMVFERTNIDTYKFTVETKRELEPLKARNTANKLFLSTATKWNSTFTKDAFLWFAEEIDTYDSRSINDAQYLEYLDKRNNSAKTKAFLLSMLKHAEINIEDYDFESKTAEDISIPLPSGIMLDQSVLEKIKKSAKLFRLSAIHSVNNSGNTEYYDIDFNLESNGTKMVFAYGPIIEEALEKGRTIVIDELDNSLHPSLTRYLVNLFNDMSVNVNGAQLIFNTHDISLLDLDIFRRDQIYFVEKKNNAQTDVYSLADFSPRKGEKVQRGYLQGRYGAIPFVVGGIEWEA